MRRLLLKLAIAAFTFLLGISASFVRSAPHEIAASNKRIISHSPFDTQCYSDSYLPLTVADTPTRSKDLDTFYSAMQEWPFVCVDRRTEIYRLLVIPSLDSPATMRIWQDGNQRFMAIKQLTQVGVPQAGAKDLKVSETRIVTEDEWKYFQKLLSKSGFWSMPERDSSPHGLDGITVVFEGNKAGEYHAVIRWSDKDEHFQEAIGYLFELARLQWQR